MTLLVDLSGGHASAPLFLAQTGTPALAPAPTPLPADAQPSMWSSLVPLLMIVGVFFLFMAPQMKRNKEQQKLLAALQPGDEIVTTGGMHGVVTAVKPDRFVIEIAKGVRIEVNRANVEARAPQPAADKDKDKKD